MTVVLLIALFAALACAPDVRHVSAGVGWARSVAWGAVVVGLFIAVIAMEARSC